MKTLLVKGPVTITEAGGVITTAFNASIGGGSTAGIVKIGPEGISVDLNVAQKALFAWLNAKLPAGFQIAAVGGEEILESAEVAVE